MRAPRHALLSGRAVAARTRARRGEAIRRPLGRESRAHRAYHRAAKPSPVAQPAPANLTRSVWSAMSSESASLAGATLSQSRKPIPARHTQVLLLRLAAEHVAEQQPRARLLPQQRRTARENAATRRRAGGRKRVRRGGSCVRGTARRPRAPPTQVET